MKKKIMATLFILLIVISGSGVVLSQYPNIKERANANRTYVYSDILLDTLLASNYAINYHLYDIFYDNKPTDVYLDLRDTQGNAVQNPNDTGYSYIYELINTTIHSWDSTLVYNCSNLVYYAIDKTSGEKYFSKNKLKNIHDGENLKSYIPKSDEVGLETTIKDKHFKYQWVITLTFDENGNIFVQNQSNSKSSLNDETIQFQYDEFLKNRFPSFFNTDQVFAQPNRDDGGITNGSIELTPDELQTFNSKYQFNKIKNMTVVYALPEKITYNDEIASMLNDPTDNDYWYGGSVIILSVFIAIFLIGLLTPIRFVKESTIVKSFHKIPTDILVALWCFVPFLFISSMTQFIQLTNPEQSLQVLYTSNTIYAYGLNFLLYVGLYLITLLSTLSVKISLSKGWHYFIQHTLLYKLMIRFKKMTNAIFHYLDNIDLKDSSNLRLLGVLIVNFILICFMISQSYLGILFAIIYSFCLLIFIQRYLVKVKNNYLDLLEVTKNIAQGNLDKEVNQDLGIFNSFKEDILHIRHSFKNAIEEEVKSQKMKTELISNVSHDLKTPLTNIITYTDLLKREDISEEDRASYISTLENNEVRLKLLIEDLFEVSKVNSGNVKLTIQQVDIVALITQAFIEHEDNLKQLSLSIKTNYSDDKILLNLDSQKTYRILSNLIINISKYAMANSRVYIDVTDYGESVEVSFKNMSANEIDFDPNDIVERFSRGDKSRNSEGSGLGLAIAKSFTELQGGSFLVYVDGDLFKAVMRFHKQ